MPFRSPDRAGNICILGAGGSLGRELANVFGADNESTRSLNDNGFVAAPPLSNKKLKIEVHGFSRLECDITQRDKVREILDRFRPAVLINCAAYTDVDGAERNPETAMEVNGTAVGTIATEAHRVGAGLIHFSTDFVYERVCENIPESGFDELVEPDPLPMGRYAASKLQGEKLALANNPGKTLVLRTGNLYGRHGVNFASLLPTRLERPDLVLDDTRVMTPTWTGSLALQTALLVERNPDGGIYHVTCGGSCVWADFGAEICRLLNMQTRYRTGGLDKLSAPRPEFHVLKNRRLQELNMDIMPHWKAALAQSLGV